MTQQAEHSIWVKNSIFQSGQARGTKTLKNNTTFTQQGEPSIWVKKTTQHLSE